MSRFARRADAGKFLFTGKLKHLYFDVSRLYQLKCYR